MHIFVGRFGTPGTRVRIRIPNTDPAPDPAGQNQCGSGSVSESTFSESGSETQLVSMLNLKPFPK
jgi:hypothetical protein